MTELKPFWCYYGGKYRAAPRYPKPLYDTIIEPFAGAAGYALRHFQRKVILVEKYDVIAEMWRYLIGASSTEILAIPYVEHVDELPAWVPQGGRSLVGFSMSAACASPRKQLSSGRRNLIAMGRKFEGWSKERRARVASQVEHIRHWKVIEGNYTRAPRIAATWFVDPPYERQGHHYVHSQIDYVALASWCKRRRGQVLVCENEGASWLPFQSFAAVKKSQMYGAANVSHEVIWTNAHQ